jgi:hypothetical protein
MLRGEIQDFKLRRIWYSCPRDVQDELLKEFGPFTPAGRYLHKYRREDDRSLKNATTERRQREWLRGHPALRRSMVGTLAVVAPYLFLSPRYRWLMSVGRFKEENAAHPKHPAV